MDQQPGSVYIKMVNGDAYNVSTVATLEEAQESRTVFPSTVYRILGYSGHPSALNLRNFITGAMRDGVIIGLVTTTKQVFLNPAHIVSLDVRTV